MATRFLLLREQTDEQEKWGHRRMGAHCYLLYVVKSGEGFSSIDCRVSWLKEGIPHRMRIPALR